jgi:GTPase
VTTTKPRVAIIGYPNVGKSTLFNRITGSRDAVVAPESGVTRDRKEGDAEWAGREFVVVDTGGIDLQSNEPLGEEVRRQARSALEEAAVAIFLVDGKSGLAPQDHEIAAILRRSPVPVILAVNKYDSKAAQDNLHEYWQLGIGDPIGVSAEHGLGIGDLLDEVVKDLPQEESPEAAVEPIKVAIVGRPNVGKSSLLNALLGDQRTIVSPRPGTTRDAIDTDLEFDGSPMQLIDTAGLRRPGKRTTTDVEYYSSLRALQALERCHVALVVVDASEGLVDLDLQVAYEAQRANCATAVLFNKWDIHQIDLDMTVERLRAKVQMKPRWLTVSAITRRGVDHILPLARELYQQYSARIPTAELNRWLEALRAQRPPAGRGAKTIKAFYMVQYESSPPRFKVMVNSRSLVTKSFAYYVENRLREQYGLWGIPLVINFEGKEERYS